MTMSMANPMTRPGFKFMVYFMLVAGSAIFVWPLVWMVGTSCKADNELFKGTLRLFPQSPNDAPQSPYIDSSVFDTLKGKRSDELLPVLEARAAEFKSLVPSDVDQAEALRQLARGCYMRLQTILPKESWDKPAAELASDATKQVDEAMIKSILGQIRKNLMLGQFRARSYDIQEDILVKAQDAASTWNVEGPAGATLKTVEEGSQTGAEVHYDFSKGDSFRLSKTFPLSFDVSRLYRIQLSWHADESWHPLTAYIEKQGKLYVADRITPMNDSNWSEITWQEPGPDDLSNKIRTWIHLKPTEDSGTYESDPHKIKVILEFDSVGSLMAWVYKIKRNYLLVFDNMPFWRYAATSVFLVILNLVGNLFSCSVVAYAFARMRWPGRSMSYALMLGTMMVPSQVTMIPFFLIVRYLGWYNTLYPLWICSFFASAFNVFLLHQFFKGIPTDLEDAAKIDGCGPLRIYWYIMLPLIKPALATIAIFVFMFVWNDFMSPLIYLSDQRLYPLSLGLFALQVQSGGSTSMSVMLAGSLLMLLPVIVIFFFAQRYFIEGITMTGLKS
jgi:multiple sugar transport system permease protein